MKAAVIGSRSFDDYELMKRVLSGHDIKEVISGGAIGADTLGAKYAQDNQLDLTVFLPEYKQFGRGATFIRNTKIVERADEVFAFWDMESKGTAHSLQEAHRLGKVCHIINVKKDPFE